MKRKMPINGAWLCWDDRKGTFTWGNDLSNIDKEGVMSEEQLAGFNEEYDMQYVRNPLSYFLPHSGQKDFLNDRDNGICALIAPNRSGKSFAGAAFTALRIMPCDPDWPMFQNNGVDFVEYEGPKQWIVASESWDNVEVVWQTYRELFPRSELGEYSPGFPKEEFGEQGKGKSLLFGDGRPKYLPLACGSRIIWLCYNQQQMHWESRKANGAHFDEQPSREKFTGYRQRTITEEESPQCCVTCTGHVVDSRSDTGAGGFVHRICEGRIDTGFTVGQYHISLNDVPDAIIAPDRKKAEYRSWVEIPSKYNDHKTLAEAEARYWGRWQATAGMMLDEWVREIHVIPPLWPDDHIPPEATLFRVLDHGEVSPTACVWIAMMPPDNHYAPYMFAVVYRLFYQANCPPAVSVPEIIRMSHNDRIKTGTETDPIRSETYDTFLEVKRGEVYNWSIMDSRSKANRVGGMPIGALYARYGIDFRPADGKRDEVTIPFIRDFLRINNDKPHIVTKKPGAPMLYVFDLPCTRPLVDEIETWQRDPNDSNKPKKGQQDHAIDCIKFWCASQPHPEPQRFNTSGEYIETEIKGSKYDLYGSVLTEDFS